ncbi:MAG: hypothetical protein IKH44_14035 [Bacteroidales bacterium]|nr:hypothetical protein [Bacteroidales bacterium]
MQKYTFLEYYGCCFGEKKVSIAGLISLFKPCHVGLPQVSESMSFPCLVSLASTGMSSLWEQVGKGMGSMPGETVHIKLLPINRLIPAQE